MLRATSIAAGAALGRDDLDGPDMLSASSSVSRTRRIVVDNHHSRVKLAASSAMKRQGSCSGGLQ